MDSSRLLFISLCPVVLLKRDEGVGQGDSFISAQAQSTVLSQKGAFG